jgi:hypothetical protein
MHAGTTWLSELLRSYPDCALVPPGEVHFFDVRHGQYSARTNYISMADQMKALTRAVAKGVANAVADIKDGIPDDENSDEDAEAGLLDRPNGVAWTDEVRMSFFRRAALDDVFREILDIIDRLSIVDTASYVRYLRRHSAGATAFGEIAPTYGLLPAAAFAEIDSVFPQARFVFIMRDPVERLWSHICFKAERSERRGRKRGNLNGMFCRALERRNAVEFSNYHNTIRNLESVIPSNRILYLFYETMTSHMTGPAEVRRIETALGLASANIDPKVFCNASEASPSARLDPENAKAAAELFSPVYKFVHERFGIPAGWNDPMASSRSKAKSRR